MYLLYLDESGTHDDASHLIVGGLALFERSTFWLKKELDQVVERYFADGGRDVHLHASSLWTPDGTHVDGPLGSLSAEERRALARDAYRVLSENDGGPLFATAVKKSAVDRDPYEVAFEDLISRFDRFLARRHAQGDRQRGLIVVAKSNYEAGLRRFGRQLYHHGTRWADLRNMADLPLFAPAAELRLLQAADLVANAVYGFYERGLAGTFMQLLPRFDREGDRLHGLTHITDDASTCFCQACLSWRTHREGAR